MRVSFEMLHGKAENPSQEFFFLCDGDDPSRKRKRRYDPGIRRLRFRLGSIAEGVVALCLQRFDVRPGVVEICVSARKHPRRILRFPIVDLVYAFCQDSPPFDRHDRWEGIDLRQRLRLGRNARCPRLQDLALRQRRAKNDGRLGQGNGRPWLSCSNRRIRLG